ncbi:unnamed protein product [Nyctereutes procyonoides]|uniref:(raccoon dog) hypothetical protein n=1 Tax=Nyctereutes procyonoides TaxID=34880 RepID=A0A811XVH2_NYCPR|nr:unnamed protein product [Nyctereutes procyonoides]
MGDNGGRRGVEEREGSRYAGPASRLGAPKSLGKASRGAGGPGRRPSQGHVGRSGRCRRAPRVGRAAGEWPPGGAEGRGAGPSWRPTRPSPLTTRRPRGEGLPTPRSKSGSSASPGPLPARRTPSPLVLLRHSLAGSPSYPEVPPVRPRMFTGTRGGGDSSVPRLRWQPVPSPDHSD